MPFPFLNPDSKTLLARANDLAYLIMMWGAGISTEGHLRAQRMEDMYRDLAGY